MFLYSPLEQFSINKLLNITIFCFDFSITNSTILVVFSSLFAFFFFTLSCANAKIIPGG